MLTLRALGCFTGTSVQLLTLLAFYAGGCDATCCALLAVTCLTGTKAPILTLTLLAVMLLAALFLLCALLAAGATRCSRPMTGRRRYALCHLFYWYKSTNADSTRLIAAAPPGGLLRDCL
jgi:hypothetical protein